MVALRTPGLAFSIDSLLRLRPTARRRHAPPPPPSPAAGFDYQVAFSRNLGWTTPGEQELLRATRIGVAGLEAVGAEVLATLVRLGVGGFALVDDDRRRRAALAERAADINPEARIDRLGFDWPGVEAVAQGATLVVDALPPAAAGRGALHHACRRAGVPVLVAVALGTGAAICLVRPDGPEFADLVGWHPDHDPVERAARLLVGMAPAAGAAAIAAAARGRLPAAPPGAALAGGLAGTEALKLALRRGALAAAPRARWCDPAGGVLRTTWRPGGMANPLQRLLLARVRRLLAAG